jgi:hypothetical protein
VTAAVILGSVRGSKPLALVVVEATELASNRDYWQLTRLSQSELMLAFGVLATVPECLILFHHWFDPSDMPLAVGGLDRSVTSERGSNR